MARNSGIWDVLPEPFGNKLPSVPTSDRGPVGSETRHDGPGRDASKEGVAGIDPIKGEPYAMVSATNTDVSPTRARFRNRPRSFALLVALSACCAGSGCARIRSFRNDDRPAFGTEPVAASKSGSSRAPSGDLYAESVGGRAVPAPGRVVKPSAANDDLIAQAKDRVESASHSEPRAANQKPLVALQPPIALPPFDPSSKTAKPEVAAAQVVSAKAGGGPGGFTWKGAARPDETTPPIEATRPKPTLESILAESRKRLDALSGYQVAMNHQERVGGTLSPAEDVVLSIRRNPKAVRIEWREGASQGREVLYAADTRGGLMHVKMGGPLGATLPRLSIAPDSSMARRSSRHPITEAGFDTIVQHMEEGVQLQKAGGPNADKIRLEGCETPESLDRPCYKVVRQTSDHETWTVFIDAENYLPVFVKAEAGDGQILERYVFTKPVLNPAELASADAFDPDARWGPAKGLLQRLAQATETVDKPGTTQTR